MSKRPTRRLPRDVAALEAIRDGRKDRAATIPCARKQAARKACRGRVKDDA